MTELTSTQLGWMAGAQALGDMFNVMGQNYLLRSNFRINKIQAEINDIASESALNDALTQLHQSQRDRQAQVTQEVTQLQSEYRKRLAEAEVYKAERGMEGQSIDESINDITKSYHAYKQVILRNQQALERQDIYTQSALYNQRFQQKWSNLLGPRPDSMLNAYAAGLSGFNDYVLNYANLVNWTGDDLGGDDGTG